MKYNYNSSPQRTLSVAISLFFSSIEMQNEGKGWLTAEEIAKGTPYAAVTVHQTLNELSESGIAVKSKSSGAATRNRTVWKIDPYWVRLGEEETVKFFDEMWGDCKECR